MTASGDLCVWKRIAGGTNTNIHMNMMNAWQPMLYRLSVGVRKTPG